MVRLIKGWVFLFFICFFPVLLSAQEIQDDVVTPEERERAQEIRERLVRDGFLQEQPEDARLQPLATTATHFADAWYTGKSLSVQTTNSRASDFRSDGSRFYILGRNSLNVVEYRLSTSWDLETASYVRELDISSQMGSASEAEQAPNGLYIRKTDGQKMWIINRTEIWEYTLDTPWNVSSAKSPTSLDLSENVVRGHDLDFKPDGTVLYIDDRTTGLVHQYNLSTPWDIKTASHDMALDISGQQEEVRGTQLNDDGTRLFLIDTARQDILEYSVSSPYDLETASYIGSYSVSSQTSEPRGITFRPGSDMFYVTATNNNRIYQYKISTPDSDESSLASSRSKVIANGSATSRIDVTIRDSDGDRMTGRPVSLSSSSSNSAITNVNSTTNTSGVARFDVSNSEIEHVTFTARSGGVTIDETVSVRFVGLDAGESGMVSAREKVIADGNAAGRITVTVRDEDGDRLEGVRISLDASSSNASVRNINRDTNSSGEATFDVSNSTAETVTFSATGMGQTIEETVTVNFVTIDPAESSVASNREKVIANGEAAARITVTARDEDGDLLPDAPISLSSGSSAISVRSVNSTTNSDGVARFDVSSSTIESVRITASGLGVEIDQTVNIRFAGVDAGESSVVSSHQKVQANGSAFSTITVTVRDEDGDELEGVAMSLSAGGGSSDIENVQRTTNSDGIARFRVRNEIAESVTYTARGMGVDISQTVAVNFVTVDPGNSSVIVDQAEVEANGEANSRITVVARDEDNDILEGVEIELSMENGNSQIEVVEQFTNVDGQARFRVRSNSPGRATFRATAIRTGGNVVIDERGEVAFIPVAPVVLSATDATTSEFNANWEVVPGADSYQVDVSADSSFSSFVEEATNAGLVTDYRATGLNPGTVYHYRVRAVADDLVGANSTAMSVVTFPEVPDVRNASGRSITRFTARWEAAPGAREYLLDVAEDAEFTQFLPGYENVEVGDQLAYDISGLFPGTNYYYRVRAVAFNRISDNSTPMETSTVEIGLDQSDVESSQLRVLANGVQENIITVTLKDTNGNPLQNEEITLSPESGNSQVAAVRATTNENGQAVFAVTNQTAEIVNYRAKVAETFEIGSISAEFLPVEGRLVLGDNYPNPFAGQTIIPVTVPQRMQVRIEITNVLGAIIQSVINEDLSEGYYEIPVDLRSSASGVYFYRMFTNEGIETKKMLLVR